jgi:hypothetical protein
MGIVVLVILPLQKHKEVMQWRFQARGLPAPPLVCKGGDAADDDRSIISSSSNSSCFLPLPIAPKVLVYRTSDQVHRVQNLLECLSQATAEVRASCPLRQLLHLIRYAGNRLNMQGSLDCKAAHSPETIRAVMARYAVALKINDKLMQVLDTKTFHEHGSKLIHFVVAMCARPFCAFAAFPCLRCCLSVKRIQY